MYFCPILRVAMFSYPVGGQVFGKMRAVVVALSVCSQCSPAYQLRFCPTTLEMGTVKPEIGMGWEIREKFRCLWNFHCKPRSGEGCGYTKC